MNSPKKSVSKRIESLCRKAMHDFALLEGVHKLGVALSGGKDSLSLLYTLAKLRGFGFERFELFAFHITGDYSCGAGVSLKFLHSICSDLNVPLIIKKQEQNSETLECYGCSRVRRTLIFNAAKEVGVTHIALGHHRDDAIQTLMMNLLQKGEFASLLPKVPMIKYGITLLRPLIYVSEEMLKEFAKQCGFARITCQCPVGIHSKRKQTDRLLSQMQECFPNARANLATAALEYGSKKALTP